MNQAVDGIISVALAIVGIAIVAVLVSRQSDTKNVIGAAGSAFSNAIRAATGPVTGGSIGVQTGYSGGQFF